MKAVFYSYFHFNWLINPSWFTYRIKYYKFFFFSYSIITSIDNNMDVISIQFKDIIDLPKSNSDAIVCLKLFLNSIESKVVFS